MLPRDRRLGSLHAALVASVSTLAVTTASPPAQARNLLQGGSTAITAMATAATQSASAQAAAIAQQAQVSLVRAAATIQAMRAAQAKAHAAASSTASNIADGTNTPTGSQLPGLVVDPRVASDASLWINANQPSQTSSNGQTTVTIQQTAQNAVLTWQYFNISRSTTLVFDQQGNASWVALNRIAATGVPSQISGQIKADGTVLLINPNGIIFNGSSQINVHTLIATSFDIDSNSSATVFNGSATYSSVSVSGVTLTVPPNEDAANKSFVQSGLFTNADATTGALSTTFSMGNQTLGSSGGGAIVVQPGASITTSVTTAGDGGYVALLGPQVTNRGTITTQNGQIILAAGNQISITAPLSAATGVPTALALGASSGGTITPSTISGGSLAANDAGFIDPNDPTSFVNGLLISNDGAVTVAGDTIRQLGGIAVTTSVTQPGSISLSSANATPANLALGAGNIILGPSSATTILPDETSSTILTGTATASYFSSNLQPQIAITAAGSVDVQGGAQIKAPSAALAITAGSAGSVVLESGSTIDLSGMNVTLPMSANTLSILVTSAEVADTPLARNLIGQTVTIDVRKSGTRPDGFGWVGSPILDAAGYVNTIPQTIDQVLTAGGSFTASAQSLIQLPGSVVAVSGGFVGYSGGTISTTRLLGSNGRLYDIGSADPTISYVVPGPFTVNHRHWNVTETYPGLLATSTYYEPGYVTGANAGAIGITAANPILAGSFVADIVTGSRQRSGVDKSLPAGASLSVTFTGNLGGANTVVVEPVADAGADPFGLSSFTFGSSWTPSLAKNLNGNFPMFSDSLSTAGFGSIAITTAGGVLSMPTDATLTVQPGGKVTLGNVGEIDGTINAPSGSITLNGFTSGLVAQLDLIIGPHALLNVRGLWVNDSGLSGDAMLGSAFIDGGSVTITTAAAASLSAPVIQSATVSTTNADGITSTIALDASYSQVKVTDITRSIVLAPGSTIDAASGGYVGQNGKLKIATDGLTAGKGGSVALQTYVGLLGKLGTAATATAMTLQDGTIVAPGTAIRYALTAALTGAGVGSEGPYAADVMGANVLMDGTIHATGFDGGGTFSLQSAKLTIDGTATAVTSYRSTGSSVSPRSGEIVLPTTFFTGNAFSQYTLSAAAGGVTVTADTVLDLQQSNYLAPAAAVAAATGAEARDFAGVGLAPDAVRKPVGLTLSANGGIVDTGGAAGITVGAGARINAEAQSTISLISTGAVNLLGSIVAGPRSTVTLLSSGQAISGTLKPVNVLGSIVAPGGAINLVGAGAYPTDVTNSVTAPGQVWIGSGAVLDVSGELMQNLLVPYPSGTVLDGGTITLDADTVVVQQGALLRLAGAVATIAGTSEGSRTRTPIWSNGGALQVAGSRIYFAGTVDARGGVDAITGQSAPLASGGSLTIGNVQPSGALASLLGSSSALAGPDQFIIEQSDVPVVDPSIFTALPTTARGLTAMVLGAQGLASTATPVSSGLISVDTLNNSGFDSVAVSIGHLASSGFVGQLGFSGTMKISLPGSLILSALGGDFSVLPASATTFTVGKTPAGTVVTLDAGYIRLAGSIMTTPTSSQGALNLTARWIDVEGNIGLDNVANATFTSASAIRLLPGNYGTVSASGATPSALFGSLKAPGNLTLQAAEIYPVSATSFLIQAQRKLTIKPNGAATAPLSAGGTLVLDAQTIDQGGALWVPLGSIVIGLTDASQLPSPLSGTIVPTTNVTLEAGSTTSVSAAGLDIPYGYTIDDTSWSYGRDNSGPLVLASAPAKSIAVYGTTVVINAAGADVNGNPAGAAIVDASGGGDIYATEYVAGTGGTRNVLTTYEYNAALSTSDKSVYQTQYADGRQVYALVPAYQAAVAAYDPVFAGYPYYSGQAVPPGTNAQFTLNSAQPAVNYPVTGIASGTAITIAGGNGIAAGTYVLLPGMYATLPGAYRVVQVAGNVNPATTSFTGADGSLYVAGYATNTLTGARAAQASLFQLQSGAVWSKYSRIDITSGTSFFRSQTLAAGNAVPALPIDGGILTLGATGSLTLAGINRFNPGSSDLAPTLEGASGQIDISAGSIVITDHDRLSTFGTVDSQGTFTPSTAYGGYLFLDADQISNLGAGSVLIGATASATTPGFLTANTTNLEVATDASHPLTGPELILVSKAGGNGITIDAGSVIQAEGAVAGSSRDITIGVLPVPIIDPATNKVTGYKPGVSGDGSLLRVSDGTAITVTRIYVPGLYTGPGPLPGGATAQGSIAIGTTPTTTSLAAGAAVTIDGGNSLTVDTSGNSTLAAGLTGVLKNADGSRQSPLIAHNYLLSGSVFNLGDAPPGTQGFFLTADALASFAGAQSVTLRSATVFNLYDQNGLHLGDASSPIGVLTFDGAGLFSAGGSSASNTTIDAANIDLINSTGATGAGAGLASGTLVLKASGTITEDAGAKSLAGFSQINWNAGQAIVFSGAGGIDSGPVATATASLGVASIAVTSGGSGYTNGAAVTIAGPGGAGFAGTAIVDASGTITKVDIISRGAGYTGAITSVSVAGGTGANLTALLGVVGVAVTGAGDGYDTATTVSIVGGGGSGTAATTSALGGVVTGVTVSNLGSGYTGVPTVTFSGHNMTLTAPTIIVSKGTQSLTTEGLTIEQGAGAAMAPAAGDFGGALTLTAASIQNGGPDPITKVLYQGAPIWALAGNVTLEATSGDVVLNPGAAIRANGATVAILDQTRYAPGGTVKLISDNGNVTINTGIGADANGNPTAPAVDVSAAGTGYAGSLVITTGNSGTTGTATLNGALTGRAAFNDIGGSFNLAAGSLVGTLPLDTTQGPNFSGSYAVTLGSGDIRVAAGQTLTSTQVTLTANAGSVTVEGAPGKGFAGGIIDASGPNGGAISLFGAGGVTLGGAVYDSDGKTIVGAGAQLYARYAAADPRDLAYANGTSTLVPNGGTITLGTTGTATGALNPDGSEQVASSGRINVMKGAMLDVSAGIGGTGGSVIVRAPLLTDGSGNLGTGTESDGSRWTGVRVSFNGTVLGITDASGNPSGNGVALDAYKTWSTTDASTGGQHFDGIIDPAGWYDRSGRMIDGSWEVLSGGTVSSVEVTDGGAYTPTATITATVTVLTPSGTLLASGGTTATTYTKANGKVKMGVAGTGSDAVLRGIASNVFDVITIPAGAGGAGYRSAPTVTFNTPSGGTPATGIANLTNGVVTSITITNPGSGYTATPTMTFGGGNPTTPATNITAASAAIKLQVVSVAIASTSGVPVGVTINTSSTTGTTAANGAIADITCAACSSGVTASVIATERGGVRTNTVATSQTGFFVPSGTLSGSVNSDHSTFYQYTLVNFVQNPFRGSANAVAADFASVSSNLHLRPEISLVNPSSGINSGNITVASNWNLGAGIAGISTFTPYYRTDTGTVGKLVNRTAFTDTSGNAVAVGTVITDSSGTLLTADKSYSGQLGLVEGTSSFTPHASTTSDPGEPGVLRLRAENNVAIQATISDGFYETRDAFAGSVIVANKIANNPQRNGSVVEWNTTAAASLMPAMAGIDDGSFSYDFVAGAASLGGATPSVNPDAVVALPSATKVDATAPTFSVTLGGHTSYLDTTTTTTAGSIAITSLAMINIPTLVRTGTGSITVTAAANVELTDAVAPGAIYTAGAAQAIPASYNFTAPVLPATYLGDPNGLLSTPAWAAGGGSVTIGAGRSIIGIETVVKSGTPTSGQLWSDWYEHYGSSDGSTPFSTCVAGVCQTAAWVNYATFFQGFGALGGGSVALTAGRDIIDVAASLPESLLVGGGRSVADGAPTLHSFGGGNLLVKAGGDLNSGDFLVGRGSGLIEVGGAVQADGGNPITGQATVGFLGSLPLLLAVQDGFVTVNARGAVTLGNVYDPASLPLDAAALTPIGFLPGAVNLSFNGAWNSFFTSFGPQSGVALNSTIGDVTALTVPSNSGDGLFNHATTTTIGGLGAGFMGDLLPASFELTALVGQVTVLNAGNDNLLPYPTQSGSDTGTIDIVAANSITVSNLTMPDLDTASTQYMNQAQTLGAPAVDLTNYISPLGVRLASLKVALHANDPTSALIVAGQSITMPAPNGSSPELAFIKPALIEAGGNITLPKLIGQNNNATDVTSIIAGGNIVGGSLDATDHFVGTGTYYLYGPGQWLLQAGGSIGPFQPSTATAGVTPQTTYGVMAVGDGSNYPRNSLQTDVATKFYLPRQSADITVLFGVKPGVAYQAAINRYVDPAGAGAGGIDLLTDIAAMLGETPSQAWRDFQAMSPARQHLLIDRAFLDFLTQVATDFRNPTSPFFDQYGRAYQAIATLFPAAFGYTDNSASGSSNGAAARVSTGTLNISKSVLETQLGGNITILGPGGSIIVGSNSLDVLKPSQEGILTLAGGSIRAFTDGSILLNQSRIMTEQGGDIDLFSANGDINAGEGPKTYASSPAFSPICDINGFCRVNPSGLVTGGGIGALVTLPGQDPKKSNVTLVAPHGTVDAGAAGIRGSDVNIIAKIVLNAYNISATDTVTGVPTAPPTANVSLNNAASSAAGTTRLATPADAPKRDNDTPSIIIVEVLGYGGTDGTDEPKQQQERRPKPKDQRSQNPASPIQIVGAGQLTEHERQILTDEEKRDLVQ